MNATPIQRILIGTPFFLWYWEFFYSLLFALLRDLSYGKGTTAPIRGAALPKISKVDAWDGKDGVLPVEDEDEYGEEKDEL